MTNIIIIGGGASGLVCAIKAAKNKNNHITILERNSECAKKILATGNGRCNYFNEDFTINHYLTNNKKTLETIITKENKEKVLNFFDNLGIVPKIKNGYYYPFSNQALTIKEALLNKIESYSNIEIKTNFYVNKIEKKNRKFIIHGNERLESDILVIATGSFASPKSGSDGNGYDLLKDFNFRIVNPLPALTPLKANAPFLKEWQGVRCEAELSHYEDEKLIRKELGEVQLTKNGISGICTFNISNRLIRGLNSHKEVIRINFLPFLKNISKYELLEWFNNRNSLLNNPLLKDNLNAILNNKVVNVIIDLLKITKDDTWNSLSSNKKEKLLKLLTEFELEIVGYQDYEFAQSTSGGISLEEVNIMTMESTYPNLYLLGEILDVVGDCGGYNLGFAWLSGILSGNKIGE